MLILICNTLATSVVTYSIGFLAQAFFSARILVQWILSERNKQIVSPSLFWVCSLVGSILLFAYGWLRNDFSIIFGQFLTYYIYIWNLKIKGVWQRLLLLSRLAILVLPFVALIYMLCHTLAFEAAFFHNSDVPLPLLLYGSIGQAVFTIRFIYQWYYSFKRCESVLPVGFWIISLVGSGMIVSYGIFRADIVLILGQLVGFMAYSRNLIIYKRSRI